MNNASSYHGLVSYGFLAGLAIALLAAAAGDLRHRRIDNRLNAAIALAAPLFWWAGGLGMAAIGGQLALAAACFGMLTGLFALGAIGGGDVKLLTALALWIRPLWFVQLLAVMALAGGGLTLMCLFRLVAWRAHGRPRNTVTVPYGIAIALGGLWVLACDYLPVVAAGRQG
jgi:prepilin peptidase CpaA